MFTYEIKDAEPSQEVFMEALGCLLLVGLTALGISGLIDMIKEKFKSLDQKLLEHSEDLADEIELDLSEYSENDYPRVDWTDATAGKHWEIDKEILEESKEWEEAGDPLIAEGFVELKDIVPFYGKYLQYLQFLTGLAFGQDTLQKLNDKFIQTCGKTVTTDKKGITGVVLPRTNVKWPNSPWFKTPEACAKKLYAARMEIPKVYKALAGKAKRAVEESTDGKTKEYLQGKAAFLKACEAAMKIDDILADEYWFDGIGFKLNNDEVFGACLVLINKNGKDITSHH